MGVDFLLQYRPIYRLDCVESQCVHISFTCIFPSGIWSSFPFSSGVSVVRFIIKTSVCLVFDMCIAADVSKTA